MFFGLIPKWFALHEHILDAGLGFFHATEAEERLAFEVEDVLFGGRMNILLITAGEDVGQLFADDGIVFRS